MVKFQQKILDVLGPLSRPSKGLEKIKKAPDDTIPVSIENHIKLIDQTVLLPGQASNAILHSRRLQILKTLIKDPKKAKKYFDGKSRFTSKRLSKSFWEKVQIASS